MNEKPFFPLRLFRWFVSRQVLLAGFLFLLACAALVFWLEVDAGGSFVDLKREQGLVLLCFAVSYLIFVIVSYLSTRRLVIPLGRLIEKTRRLREFPFEADEAPEELSVDEPGEWYELERALNRLGRDLRQKTIRLSREKTEIRAIMSAVSEAVLAVNSERRVLFYNPQLAVLFDVKSTAPEMMGITDIIRSPNVLKAYDESLRSGQTVRIDVSVTVLHERLPRTFQLSVAPLRKKHNQEIYGAVGIFHDITALKQAEKIRIEFVGNVSHELRTPLTSINGYLQTINADVKSGRIDQIGEFLEIVTGNVERLKLLVEDLLDLSNLESGAELTFEEVGTADVTESVLEQLTIRHHKIRLLYDVETVWADSKRVEQVLRNLIENAVRYVPHGKNITIHWRAPDAAAVELIVKDDGPGIPLEHQARLFERFYRVDESRARSVSGGTGIGLSIVKHIMQRHDGSVTVNSQAGRGAEFVCYFPNPAGGETPP